MDYSKCKCWIRPFEPPIGCYDFCAGNILRYAKPSEMSEYFYISVDLSEKIFEISSNDEIRKLSEFEPYLENEEYSEVLYKLHHLNAKAWEFISTKIKERTEILEPELV